MSKFVYPDSKITVLVILEKTEVASITGNAFFQSSEGENLVRFCFAKDDAFLLEGVK